MPSIRVFPLLDTAYATNGIDITLVAASANIATNLRFNMLSAPYSPLTWLHLA